VRLELFEGPLDLLLHLIQTQHIDISSISIVTITDQYLETIEMMQELDLDIAGDYLVMAATLILLKSRTLLPPEEGGDPVFDDNGDPTELFIERLKQYQAFQQAGSYFQECHDYHSRHYQRGSATEIEGFHTEWTIEATLVDLLRALRDVVLRKPAEDIHIIKPSPVTVREKMTEIVNLLNTEGSILISKLFNQCKDRQEMIVLFLGILELIRMRIIHARQRKLFGDIRIAIIPVGKDERQQ
ncbi:segregation/condensation protein A, partial [bacterium]|nr:segregation/condensation protein A [candidate division CSSED10-310 bacterium]